MTTWGVLGVEGGEGGDVSSGGGDVITRGGHLCNTVEPLLTDILYSGHLIIQDKILWSGLNLHYA